MKFPRQYIDTYLFPFIVTQYSLVKLDKIYSSILPLMGDWESFHCFYYKPGLKESECHVELSEVYSFCGGPAWEGLW